LSRVRDGAAFFLRQAACSLKLSFSAGGYAVNPTTVTFAALTGFVPLFGDSRAFFEKLIT
jgi:hypothetical protein